MGIRTFHLAEGPGKSFLPAVHGLRGLSALLVYFFHVYDMSRKLEFFPWGSVWLVTIFQMGAHGVQIFFMISGFLITGSLINHANVTRFIVDRCIRIYPVFLFIHLFSFATGPFLGNKVFYHVTAKSWTVMFVENLFFLPGILNLPLVQLNAWSLSFEALFYVIAAITYSIASRVKTRAAWLFACTVAIPLLCFHPSGIFFLIGVGVYFAVSRVRVRLPDFLSTVALTAMLILLVWGVERQYLVYLAAFPGLVLFWSVVNANCALSRALQSKLLMYFGTISYSFYLWHPVVTFPLKLLFSRLSGKIGTTPAMLSFGVLGFLGSIAISHFSYRLLEVRLARFLKRNLQGSARAVAEQPAAV